MTESICIICGDKLLSDNEIVIKSSYRISTPFSNTRICLECLNTKHNYTRKGNDLKK